MICCWLVVLWLEESCEILRIYGCASLSAGSVVVETGLELRVIFFLGCGMVVIS